MTKEGDESSSSDELLEAIKANNLPDVKRLIGHVKLASCIDKDGMTTLMHAAYKGNASMVECLLDNGATKEINTTQKDGYTALMFATLAGSTETVQMLLQAGAKTDIINKVKRTAAQLGAFCGRHNCVSIINNFVEKDNVTYYTKKHGLQEQPKLKEHLTGLVHAYIMLPSVHPVKMLFYIQKNKDLVSNFKSVNDVLENEVEKQYKGVNEILALKYHFLSCVLTKASKWENGDEGKGGVDGLLKNLLKGRSEDGFLLNMEMLFRNSIKSFPYASSQIFRQLVRTLSQTNIGDHPSALEAVTQSLLGVQSADFSHCCVTCSEADITNKCSGCKMVLYCDAVCQKLHWSTHKLFCKELKKEYEIMQEAKEKEAMAQLKRAEEKEQQPDVGALKIDDNIEDTYDDVEEKVETNLHSANQDDEINDVQVEEVVLR